jgi:predicted Zn-dependent protease
MAQTPLPRNGATFDWCRMFEQVGHLSQADTWLRTLEPEKQQDIDYWRMRMRSAMGSGDTEAWLAATQRASKLAPGDVDLALDHAWGVLVLAKCNEEVLKLLDEDLVLLKGGRKGQILTAWAEARLGRLRKAESSLRSLDALVKAPGEKAILAVAWFELLSRTDRVEEAWSVYKAMDMSLLPSPTVRQIDQEATSLATRLEKKRKFDEALKAARQQP